MSYIASTQNTVMQPFDYVSYSVVFALLFFLYCAVRLHFWDLRLRREPADEPERASGLQNHPIDTSKIAGRIRHVRENYEEELHLHPRPPAFKHEMLVRSKQDEVSKQEYFQHEQSAEENEDEERSGWSLV
jgi:hypothetical protein